MLKSDDISIYYPKIKCPVLILRAVEGMITENDLLLPEDTAENMLSQIPNSKLVNIEGTNHYTIAFYPNKARDKAIKDFLK